jgi:acyl-CoA synthetase (AMP-forming)/AMP-acid ligase II
MLVRDFLTRAARAYPRKLAYVDGDRRLTWSELDQRSDRLAAALQRNGAQKGTVVAVLAHDRLEVVEHWWACMKIGAVRTAINYRYAAREVAHIVRDSDARIVLVDATLRDLIEPELERLAGEGRRFVGIGEGHALALDYGELMAPGSDPQLPALAEHDLLAISYTSGTTGLPKGAMFTQRGMRESLMWTNLNPGLRHEDVWCNALPCAGAAMVFTAANAVTGMTCVMPDGPFRPKRFLELVAEHRITSAILVPTMLNQLVAEQRANAQDTSSLRQICYGSMPASPALIRAVQDTFGCETQQWYSATEMTASPSVVLRAAVHRRAMAGEPDLLSSCGVPCGNIELDVRDEDGASQSPGTVGEVWVRGEVVFDGYLNRPEETGEALADGWLRTGDLGRLDEEGFLYLVDRKKFMIISGGYNVFPVVVENVLAEHEAVEEVAVVGAPHPQWGEAVVAAVALREPAACTAEELISFCHGELAKWELPKHVEIVDALPKGATAKIDKQAVRAWFREDPSRLPWADPLVG